MCELGSEDRDADSVLYARRYCGIDDVQAEIACNDDAEEDDLNFLSRLRFSADADQVVYIFVDSFGRRDSLGEYTIACSWSAPVADMPGDELMCDEDDGEPEGEDGEPGDEDGEPEGEGDSDR